MKQLKFNADMAQAVKDGRKTMARRPIKLKNGWRIEHQIADTIKYYTNIGRRFWKLKTFIEKFCPYKIGDTHDIDGTQIKITGIRVERLQDISEEDAIAEGAKCTAVVNEAGDDYTGLFAIDDYLLNIWGNLPYKPPYDFYSNPFCWVIEFEKCKTS